MSQQEVATRLIFDALEAINSERAEGMKIPLALETPLFGEASMLDSLALVSVIVDIEMALGDEYGRRINLSDDRAMNRDPVPFTTVMTLRDYIRELLAEGE